LSEIVAVRKRDCSVCDAGQEVFEMVNESLWDGRAPTKSNRVYGGRENARRAMAAQGVTVDPRSVDRHRDHIEASSREIGQGSAPQTTREKKLYATDFVSVTDRAAQVGMQALDQLSERANAGILEDKALVGMAQMGLRAVTSRETANRADKQPQIVISAIFGVAGGYLSGTISESRVIEGQYSEADLKVEVAKERVKLKELQAG
jgi:hypothetical protein